MFVATEYMVGVQDSQNEAGVKANKLFCHLRLFGFRFLHLMHDENIRRSEPERRKF